MAIKQYKMQEIFFNIKFNKVLATGKCVGTVDQKIMRNYHTQYKKQTHANSTLSFIRTFEQYLWNTLE